MTSRDIRIGIIGGSGVGAALLTAIPARKRASHNPQTPFGRPSAPIITGEFAGTPIALLQRHGAGHVLNPTAVPSRANIFALKTLGCTHIIASGAVGSLREDVLPGDLVLCDQLIDRTIQRPRTFFDHAAVHVEFADPFCPVMRQWLLDVAEGLPNVRLHERGCYICMEGPAFSTRAESNLHRQWGGDVIGMTALPEARLAREAEMGYALLALPTDFDCWRPRPVSNAAGAHSLLQEIRGNLQRATEACIALLVAALQSADPLRQQPSPAHDALRLAIWSDKSKIPRAETRRLAPLWGKYFPRTGEGTGRRA